MAMSKPPARSLPITASWWRRLAGPGFAPRLHQPDRPAMARQGVADGDRRAAASPSASRRPPRAASISREDDVDHPVDEVVLVRDVAVERHRRDVEHLGELAHAERPRARPHRPGRSPRAAPAPGSGDGDARPAPWLAWPLDAPLSTCCSRALTAYIVRVSVRRTHKAYTVRIVRAKGARPMKAIVQDSVRLGRRPRGARHRRRRRSATTRCSSASARPASTSPTGRS